MILEKDMKVEDIISNISLNYQTNKIRLNKEENQCINEKDIIYEKTTSQVPKTGTMGTFCISRRLKKTKTNLID